MAKLTEREYVSTVQRRSEALLKMRMCAELAIMKPKNVQKGSWDHLQAEQLLDLLKEEIDELQQAIYHRSAKETYDEIGDCLAYLGMLIDRTSVRAFQSEPAANRG